MAKIKIGYAPTRRSIFSAPDAVKYRGLTADRLKELGIPHQDCREIQKRENRWTFPSALQLRN